MSTRRTDDAPALTLIENKKELHQIELEMRKILPKAEVSLEGVSQVSIGKISDWDPKRKLFTIHWEKIQPEFIEKTESKTGLRVYFKCSLFSTQLVFKTTTVRRLDDGSYQYRTPDQLYKQQKRGALRVPIKANSASLHTNEGDFEIVDLSVGGAKLRIYPIHKPTQTLSQCELNLNGYWIRNTNFEAKVTRKDSEFIAVKFVGLSEEIKSQIKQFLIDALRAYYEEIL